MFEPFEGEEREKEISTHLGLARPGSVYEDFASKRSYL
jgi:hypothetical protein